MYPESLLRYVTSWYIGLLGIPVQKAIKTRKDQYLRLNTTSDKIIKSDVLPAWRQRKSVLCILYPICLICFRKRCVFDRRVTQETTAKYERQLPPHVMMFRDAPVIWFSKRVHETCKRLIYVYTSGHAYRIQPSHCRVDVQNTSLHIGWLVPGTVYLLMMTTSRALIVLKPS